MNGKISKRILIIAAHPDDEILGCGASAARFVDEGNEVGVHILGEGAASRCSDAAEAEAQISLLRSAARRAADTLGCGHLSFDTLPDNMFDSVPLLDVVKRIETVIDEFRPEIVFTQHGGDINIDHVITYRATMTAVRPMQGSCVKALYAYEVPSSTEWAFNRFQPAFTPDSFVDVTAYLARKLKAMACYQEEVRPFPHPRSSEALEAYAKVRGATVGVKAAEAFQTVFRVS